MGNKTSIEWSDSTLSIFFGCTKVSRECDNCYMYRLEEIFGRDPEDVRERNPKYTHAAIKKLGNEKRIVFLNSMSDTFHEKFSFELIKKWFDILQDTPHSYISLTKRPSRMLAYSRQYELPSNFWIGTSIGTRSAYHRLEPLRKIKHHTKFLSLEPLLESVHDIDLTDIQWVIVGGESDYVDPRPFKDQWAREIREECKKQKIPFFYKQSGGKKKINNIWGTNILDGKKYLEMPEALATKESIVL